MDNNLNLQKKLRKVMIVLFVIIIPSIIRIVDENAYESVRNIDIVLLFVSGVAVGALIVLLKMHSYLKNSESD